MKLWRLESMTGSTVLLKYTYYRIYIFLDLNQHPFHQPFKDGRIYNHSWNLDLTRVNATCLGPLVSIFFERAGFEDSYRRIANAIGIELVALVGLQLVFDNGECIGRVSS